MTQKSSPQIPPDLSLHVLGLKFKSSSPRASGVWGPQGTRRKPQIGVGPLPCSSFPCYFCFLGVFLAAKLLGFFECFLLVFQGGSQGEKNPCCYGGFPRYLRKTKGKNDRVERGTVEGVLRRGFREGTPKAEAGLFL